MTDEQINEIRFKFNINGNYKDIDPKVYDTLVRQGKLNLSNDQKEEIKVIARNNFFAIDNEEYQVLLSHEEIENIITLDCKKLAVEKYFNQK